MECCRLILSFLFGLVLGSFFYTLAVRFADGSFKRDGIRALVIPSRCPSCGSRISPLHLIPLVGYLLARGGCVKCGSRISPEYPLFEIVYGFLAVLVSSRIGVNPYAAAVFLLMGLSLCISIIDVRSLSIPNPLVAAFALLSVYPVVLHSSLKDNLLGLLISFSIFLVMILVFPGGFGGGDIKLAAAIGFLLGFELSIVAIEVALVTGSIIGIIYALRAKKGLRIQIPFAPFLTAGLIAAQLWGRDIVLLYYRVVF